MLENDQMHHSQNKQFVLDNEPEQAIRGRQWKLLVIFLYFKYQYPSVGKALEQETRKIFWTVLDSINWLDLFQNV